jgi:hypothetical protein
MVVVGFRTIVAGLVDSLPPPPPVLAPVPAPSPPSYGPGDIYAQTGPNAKREQELCEAASRPDWLYLGVLALADVGSFYAEAQWNNDPSLAVRLTGPALIGLTWGATLGGGYLAMPKCSPTWVSYPPREGNVRVTWPLTLTITALAAITAPVLVGTVQGALLPNWTDEERFAHLAVASGMAIAGALLPYLIPPKTWRNARELERLRVSADGKTAYVGYTLRW